MTKTFVIGLILLTSSIALAQEAKPVASPVLSPTAYSNRTTSNPHHLVSLSTEGLGWSGSGTVFNWDENESGINSNEEAQGNLKLNYSYIFLNKFMIGGEISSKTSKEELRETNGDKTTYEKSEVKYGLTAGYNFSDDIFNSWWLKGSIGSGNYKNSTKDSSGTSEFKFDYTYWLLSVGKRFSFDSLGLRNLSYSPAISTGTAKVSGEAKEAGLETIVQVSFDIIKFDILF